MAVKLETRVAVAAKKLLKLFGPKGEHWTKDYSAIDKAGKVVGVGSRSAVRWCLSGALDKLKLGDSVKTVFSEKVRDAGNGSYITTFNDSCRTYVTMRRFLEKVVKDTQFSGKVKK